MAGTSAALMKARRLAGICAHEDHLSRDIGSDNDEHDHGVNPGRFQGRLLQSFQREAPIDEATQEIL